MTRRAARRHLLVAIVLLTGSAVPTARVSDRRAEFADAIVEFDQSSGEWTIGNDAVRYSVAVTPQGAVALSRLSVGRTAAVVTLPRASDNLITIDGEPIALGDAGSGFVVDGISAAEGSHHVSLAVRLRSAARGLIATRYYIAYPGAAAIEFWTSVETIDDRPREVQNLNAFEQRIPVGEVSYVSGLDTPADEGGAFTRRRHGLASGERLMLGSPTLSSETALPYFAVDAGYHTVFGGLAWSGAWSASFERQDDDLVIAMGLPLMSAVAVPGRPVEGPHGFLGVALTAGGSDIAAMTRFIRASRAGRGFPAMTTFNTWFVHGIHVSEDTVQRDMDYAAGIGIELFQLDAGWYPRDSFENAFDFTSGLGSWQADPARFPSGLAALSDYAHARGMQFGLWVEPERVARSTVGRPGLAEESYLATQNGEYRPGVANDEAPDAQICLAYPAARRWVENKLFQLIDEARPDNIKWDFNRWLHCTRAEHGHPVDGGNYEHTRALYEILAEVRRRYPALTIENCSGGGHRLDFALTRLTDAAWMDDRSAPSSHVRRNLNGLLTLFPAPYLFSYVMPHDEEPIRGTADLPLMVRSRMPGVVGLAASLGQLSEGELNVLNQEFELAKRLRGAQQEAVTFVLTPQRPGAGEWEVVQQLIPESGISYVFAYAERATGSVRVPLHGIRPDVVYEYRSADRGMIGRLLGADLIAAGLEILEAPESAAQVLVLAPER
jgi:alpha-galactosidase